MNMSIFDNFIQLDEKGNITYNIWVEWEYITTGLTHCSV